ncbi:AMP-binding enzyme [Streptomyces sp. NBC_00624]|uniref:AMP-binding enzyme n=1 Tax=Streptomyces sp. NBC_00624 TaxID=2975791 RepID=UPI0030E2113F
MRPDGYLTLTDEVKDVIQSGGEWISSVELEKDLMVYSAVAEAAVIGVADDRWREKPLAVVVGKTGVPAAYSNFCTFSATRAAGWQVPERWTSVETIVRSEPAPTSQKRAGLARTRALSSIAVPSTPERCNPLISRMRLRSTWAPPLAACRPIRRC